MATIKSGLVIIMLAAAVLTAGCDGPERETWLHGTWTLAHNPGHDSEDVLTFEQNGTVSIHTADDRRITGKYLVRDQALLMVLEGRNTPVEVQFQISPDRARLTYETGAYYTKKAAP